MSHGLNGILHSLRDTIGEIHLEDSPGSPDMFTPQDNGMVHLSSPYLVPETLKRLDSVLQSRGLTVFARIDHSGEAEKIGMKMRTTQLIIFGGPKGDTPLMVASPILGSRRSSFCPSCVVLVILTVLVPILNLSFGTGSLGRLNW